MKNDSPFKRIAQYQFEKQQYRPFGFDQVISYTQQLRLSKEETPLSRKPSLQPQSEFSFQDSEGKVFNIYIVEQGQAEKKGLMLPKIKQTRESSDQT